MKTKRFLSALMAFCMVFGTIAATSILQVSAVDENTEEEEVEIIDYINHVYETPEAKLADMEMKLELYGYQLYFEAYTGEVAVKNTTTGQILFTNPYDVATSKSSENIKNQLLSQIIINYTDNNDSKISMYSYVEAAKRNQIKFKNVKNGIRVEYTMGRQETRKLVPKLINAERMQTLIFDYITDESKLKRIEAFYTLKDPEDPTLTERGRREMQSTFPITKKMAVYVFDPYAVERELNLIESIIKEFCPNYTYETLEYDHLLTEYTGQDADPVLFKLSLEYYLDEDGLSVRLPANGIRFDESNYSLTYIRILPYIGAGSSEFTGYTMIPDGSGTLVRFEDIVKEGSARTIAGKLYGQDYAYHEIGAAHQQIMRLPIFGVVEDKVVSYQVEVEPKPIVPEETTILETTLDDENDNEEENSEEDTTENETSGEETTASEPEPVYETYTKTVSQGYVAIIEEGDALATIVTDHGGNVTHKYNSVCTEFYPRPKDSYNLAASISVGQNATWTVVSDRKYTGNYRIRYIMLTDNKLAEECGLSEDEYYEASYVGMALAYRDQLEKNGIITKLEQKDTSIPLYIETLGVLDVQEKILSIPVMVKKAMTTFDDLKTMTNELGEAGITNIIYRLTGFTNGGMENTTPYKVKFEKASGGNSGYQDFLEFAAEKGIEVFPDFDFSYAKENKLFDGFSYRTDAVKTIDNRYIQKRTYSATLQYFTTTGLVCISPSVFEKIFDSFKTYMDDLGTIGISVSTLGSDLNSDFDEDDPYNREDSKEFVIDTLEKLKAAYGNIMIDGGNSYAIKFASHILNISLDSSRYTYASEAIPLYGLVLHGYVNLAGTPTNMAGDIKYETLKMIENGANPYFILIYQNESELKDNNKLNKYYSVSYNIWKEDLVEIYNSLNEALSDVMYATIDDHEFLIGERVPSQAELEADAEAERLAEEAAAKEEAEKLAEEERLANLEDRLHKEAIEDGLETEPEETEEQPDETDSEGEPADSETGEETTGEEDEKTEPDEDGEESTEYVYTKYTSDNGMIVKVTYSNGIQFILNYNAFDVTVEGYTVSALGYVKINP